MNFIGHAAVARWTRSDPAYVLGSMLPDFVGMARFRMSWPLPASTQPDLAAGIALHHRTDDVFHGTPEFVRLQQSTLDRLTALGVPRGAGRAVGHIGVEMLIDGELLTDDALADSYLRAIEADVSMDEVFPTRDAADRYAQLRARLSAHGVPYDYRDPDAVLMRLQYVLASRPRLAISDEAALHVRALLPGLQREVREALPALLASVRIGLS